MSEDFQKMRTAAGLTLQQAAKLSGYSVGTINGLERTGEGSQRLRDKLHQVYGEAVGVPHLAAAALASSSAGSAEEKQAKFERAAEALVRDRSSSKKLSQLRSLLVQMLDVIDQDDAALFPPKSAKKNLPREVASNRKPSAKQRRTRLRDVDTVSLEIFGNIPAGWPQAGDGVQFPIRTIRVRKGRFPDGAFGLEVRGDSMNAARLAPLMDGDTVVLVSPEQREPRSGDIVAALIDGETTLKRLVNGDQPAHLISESSNPAFGRIYPARELTIQGVLVGKL